MGGSDWHRQALVMPVLLVLALVEVLPLCSSWSQEPPPAPAPTGERSSTDPDTTADDTSAEKAKKGSIVVVPIIITEPAVGVGLGAAVGYLWGEAAIPGGGERQLVTEVGTTSSPRNIREQERPPTITGVAGAYTDNGTWFAAVGHSASWRGDTIRYVGLLGYANVESTVYRLGLPFDFTLRGALASQDVKFRLGESPFMLGAKLSYLGAEASLALGLDTPVGIGIGTVTDVGLAAYGVYDRLDNVLMPERGQLGELNVWRYDRALGGDFDYWRLTARFNSFHPLGRRLVLGWRVDGKTATGDPPFWGYPWVTLRGVPGLRYQNERVLVTEAELRYRLHDRWLALAFSGWGATDGSLPSFENETGIVSGGLGIRYLLKPDQRIWIGIDVARGPEETNWYIAVGQAW